MKVSQDRLSNHANAPQTSYAPYAGPAEPAPAARERVLPGSPNSHPAPSHDEHRQGDAQSYARYRSATTPPLAEQPEQQEDNPQTHSDQAARRQTPNQVVVVSLLLLLVLVFFGIVYQLLFRPNTENQPENLTQDPAQRLVENQTEKLPPAPAIGSNSQLALSAPQEIPQENPQESPQENPQKLPAVNSDKAPLANTSPLSTITPTGEIVSSSPALQSSPPSQILAKAETSSGSHPVSQLLLHSKVGGTGYWIQVGAFASLQNANSIKQQLAQKSHLESVIQEGKKNTSKIYRVRIGLYTSKEAARRILRQLKNMDNSFKDSILIRDEI